jgi:hypothetical protein
LSSHWPSGQQTPRACDGTWSVDCSYDYGWNAAADSFAMASAVAGGGVAMPWWLDEDSANSWSTDMASNIGSLWGAVDYLTGAGASAIGFYSNSSSWGSLIGSRTVFASYASWVAGARNAKDAAAGCGATSITGGRIKYSQYSSGRYDADYPCF